MDKIASSWDYECDVLVVGSGSSGMTTALAAKHFGLDALLIEKAALYGGSGALSGGNVWIPNNPVNVAAGVRDSKTKARAYLNAIANHDVPQSRVDAFLDYGPEAISFLEQNTHMNHVRVPGYSDYHPEAPGGDKNGRSIEPVPFDMRKLGSDADLINRQDIQKPPGGLWVKTPEYHQLTRVTRTWMGKWTALRVGVRTYAYKAMRRQMVSLGTAGAARLRLSLKEQGIPLWLKAPLVELVMEDGVVLGAKIEKDGKPFTVRTKRGVVLTTGGFEHSEELRQKYGPKPASTAWTTGLGSNTGDGINVGVSVGGTLDLMDDAWWGPVVMTGGGPFFLLAERSLPGSIVVNGAGKRFVNESTPYQDFVPKVYEGEETGVSHVPAYLVFDNRHRTRYPFMVTPPRQKLPQELFDDGVVATAPTVEQLAKKIGIEASSLRATIDRFNGFVDSGRDLDFGRGDSIYDHYFGDPTVKPNPNLEKLEEGPFFAVKIWPGDVGTKGGLVCDERSRVLHENGEPIAGLYAAGNASASMMGKAYPGPGGTIGPAITFGYLAAKDLAGRL
ncbi:FAD-binding protein [Rhodococcus sp. IEGM1428]|uniref:FAD-binding protein n=1 Tax=Rhodococcus sp. IEGM1428 TaxID=3392191 RepID=UPI003D101894